MRASLRKSSGITCTPSPTGTSKINLNAAFAGQNVGVREVANNIWLVSLMHFDLGCFDHDTGRVECAPNLLSVKLLGDLPG